MVKFCMRVRAWEYLPHAKFCKNCLRARHTFTLCGKIIPKITNFGDFRTCKPTFLKPQPWSLPWRYGPETWDPVPNFVKIAQKIAQGACRYCIASEVMHIDFKLFFSEILGKKYLMCISVWIIIILFFSMCVFHLKLINLPAHHFATRHCA